MWFNEIIACKDLRFAGDVEEDRLFLYEFILKEVAIHVCQLFDCSQAVEVLGDVDTAATEMNAGYIRILNKKFQNANHCFSQTEYGGCTKVVGTDTVVLEEHTCQFILILASVIH